MILVDPGEYHEHLVIPVSLQITGAGAATTILDADSGGRAVTIAGATSLRIEGFTIREGQSGSDGAGIYGGGLTLDLVNDVFTGNVSYGYGGAVYIASGTANVTGCRFTGNSASQGAGVYFLDCDGSFTQNVLLDNAAGVHGGGIYLYSASLTISDNLFARCTCSWRGGAICVVVSSAPVISNNTIYACSGSEGGGLYGGSETGVIDFHNNIVVACASGSGVVDGVWPGSPPPALSCNDVWGNLPSDYLNIEPGPNDISEDPNFCNPPTDDYGLNAASPCAPAQQPSCGLIGAYDVTCGTTAVINTTWGRVKGEFAR